MRWGCLLLAACGTSAPAPAPTRQSDDCALAWGKFAQYAESLEITVTKEEQTDWLASCRSGSDPVQTACFVDAIDLEAIQACLEPPSRVVEQMSATSKELDRLVAQLESYVRLNDAFPQTTVDWTPAQACCELPARTCPLEPWDAEIWSILGVDHTRDVRFQYRYTFVDAAAVLEVRGDVGCIGETITHRSQLTREADGRLVETNGVSWGGTIKR